MARTVNAAARLATRPIRSSVLLQMPGSSNPSAVMLRSLIGGEEQRRATSSFRRMRSSISRRPRHGALRHHAVGARPAQAFLGAAARPVFAADPAGIAEVIQHGEDRGIIHLALVRL